MGASRCSTPPYLGIEWDAENRLLAVKQRVTTLASFTYDGSGLRATKTAGGVTRTYIHDGAASVEERLTGGSTGTIRYFYRPEIDARLGRQETDGSATYFVADHLGSIVQNTNSTGTATLTREYDPWGHLDATSASVSGPAFTGRDWDAETGIYYYRARYYDSKLGRFLGEDASRIWSWMNLYAYVENSPVNFTDPLGLMKAKQGVALPTGPLLINLQCLEECIGTKFEIRITETTGAHGPKNPHTRGLAADFTVGPRDPFVNPRRPIPDPWDPVPTGVSTKYVLCCARACSFEFSQYEKSGTPGATAAHFHVQIPPGKGGAKRPPLTECCK